MLCPKCKSYQPDSAVECSCGYDFELGAIRGLSRPLSGAKDIKGQGIAQASSAFSSIFGGEFKTDTVLCAIGGLSIVSGIIISMMSIFTGIAFIIFGLIVQKKPHTAFPMLIACVCIFGFETFLFLLSLLLRMNLLRLIGLVVRAFVLVYLSLGIGEVSRLAAKRPSATV